MRDGGIGFGYNAVPQTAEAERLVMDVFRSGRYSPGARVREFEERFAALHRVRHAIFVNSGTDALRIALAAMKEKNGWSEGDWVAAPALTFVATINVILQNGLRPFFVDVGMYDYLINPWNLERRLEGMDASRIRAVMPVHLFGQSCGPEIFALARKYGWKVLEDSCETILDGLRGDISCHSTYMAHHVTTGVGGLALTNDFTLNALMRSYANHGRDVSYLPGYSDLGKIHRRFQFPRIGYSSRATEWSAVLGLAQLGALPKNVRDRTAVARELTVWLGEFQELVLPQAIGRHTWMMYPILLRESSKIDKQDLCRALEEAGIETRDMMPVTNQACYRDIVKEDDFSVAREINRCGFYIPCHPGMGKEDVRRIGRTFGDFLAKARACPERAGSAAF